MNLNRKDKRKLLSMNGREIALRQDPEDLAAQEAQLAAAAENPQSSFATTMSVLAHTWYTLDQGREAARMTYMRAVKLREQGREMSTVNVVKQYNETQAEIEIVETQIVDLLRSITAQPDDGVEAAFGLLGSAHQNMQSGIGVRLPQALQVRLALEAGILEPSEAPQEAGDEPGVEEPQESIDPQD